MPEEELSDIEKQYYAMIKKTYTEGFNEGSKAGIEYLCKDMESHDPRKTYSHKDVMDILYSAKKIFLKEQSLVSNQVEATREEKSKIITPGAQGIYGIKYSQN